MSKPEGSLKSKGAVISAKTGAKESIIDLLKKAMDKGVFDAVLISMRVPAGDSFAYVLIKDKSLLKDAFPLPPVMSVQGAKAVSSVTRLGKGNMKIAAVMRPCETRATVELAKLGQTNLENITLISMDCPGVLPISDFISDPGKGMKLFDDAAKKWDDKIMRPVCQICDKSSMVAGDVHIGIHGAKKDTFFIISNSQKGNDVLDKLDIILKENIDSWNAKVKNISEEKQKKRKKILKDLKSEVGGLDNLLDTFSQCINCHNCMKVCPICYCRVCYFDSDNVKHPPEDYLQRAKNKGSIRFLPDTTLFQTGRMLHMSLSCVSCGACEDVCPVSIPVAQIFSMIADETQGLFDYVSGRDLKESLPLLAYKEEELHEVEDAND
jgi:formate dehydrogenase (coenzyme F420) beta subunit